MHVENDNELDGSRAQLTTIIKKDTSDSESEQGRYRDLLAAVQKEMAPPIETEFA